MLRRAKYEFLGFFTEKTVFMTKLNDVTTLFLRARTFLLYPGTIEPSLVSILTHSSASENEWVNSGFGVAACKGMFTILLFMERLAVKQPPLISVNSDLPHNIFCYIFEWYIFLYNQLKRGEWENSGVSRANVPNKYPLATHVAVLDFPIHCRKLIKMPYKDQIDI